MPDALATAAEQMAPARATTNFFDPSQGQSVISRYAGLRRETELADSLEKTRIARAEERRRSMLFDRDEAAYADRTAYKQQRGEFLDRISRLNPESDDYDGKVSEALATLPMEVKNDDALQSLLAYKNKVRDDLLRNSEAQLRRDEAFEDRKSLLRERYLSDPRLMGVLTPDNIKEHTNPITGEIDIVGLAPLISDKLRGNKMADTKEVIAERERVAQGRKDKELATVKQSVLGDVTAFPSQMGGLLRNLRAKRDAEGNLINDEMATENELRAKYPAEFEQAEAYEKNKVDAEMESARNYKREEYMKLGGSSLSKAQIEKRGRVWEVANNADRTALSGSVKSPRYPTGKPEGADLEFFRQNPDVTGMAVGAGLNESNPKAPRTVILNPFSRNEDGSPLTPQQWESVVLNENIRHFMDEKKPSLDFEPTPEQVAFFEGTEYGKPENRERLKETIVARILTGDESAGEVTPEQKSAAELVMKQFNEKKASAPGATPAPTKTVDTSREAALQWLKDNPNHEKAAAVRAKLGLK